MKAEELYQELLAILPSSNVDQRKESIQKMVDHHIEPKELVGLINEEEKVATRFAWFLSEVGMENPEVLLTSLPTLLEEIQPLERFNIAGSFANYWLIAGVPSENEVQAIDHCLYWIQSNEANITLKKRAFKVLQMLAKKHPDLENELKLVGEF